VSPLLLSLVLAAGPKAAPPMRFDLDAPKQPAPAPSLVPKKSKVAPLVVPRAVVDADATNCGACHSTQGWTVVKFDHAKTGFPLKGEHAHVSCKACHPVDFERALPTTCRSCHSDAHSGELGGRCENCHEELSWSSVRFDADAHRRTAFPLIGAHAQLPCEECHFSAGDRRFSRDVVECSVCHDPTRIVAVVDHANSGFSTDCRQCHLPWTFRGGQLPAHDACFPLSGGPHSRISCRDCHRLAAPPPVPLFTTCTSLAASCTGCHAHPCLQMAVVHQKKGVLGYQCADLLCAQCHSFKPVSP
jgi:hypothetical protein